MTDFKPGDVAMSGTDRVFRVRKGGSEYWMFDDASGREGNDVRVFGARPLVVIDPEDREQVEHLRAALDDEVPTYVGHSAVGRALVALTTPPKLPEPTAPGAVVEEASGKRWVLVGNHHWVSVETEPIAPLDCHWDDVAAVKVLSEGVTL